MAKSTPGSGAASPSMPMQEVQSYYYLVHHHSDATFLSLSLEQICGSLSSPLPLKSELGLKQVTAVCFKLYASLFLACSLNLV